MVTLSALLFSAVVLLAVVPPCISGAKILRRIATRSESHFTAGYTVVTWSQLMTEVA